MDKKGFEVQFNWIFAVIAGAAIIALAAFLVVKNRGITDSSFDVQTLKTVDAIVTGTGISSDVTKVSDISSKLAVGCNRIAIGSAQRNYQNIVLFAPDSIIEGKLITLTLPINLPFKVSNMLYATSPKIRYILVGKNEIISMINKSLPDSMQTEMASSVMAASAIKNTNNYKVRFIVADKDAFAAFSVPKSLEKMPNFDVSAVVVSGSTDNGEATFYQKKGLVWEPKGSSNYLTLQGLLGAVFAESRENYDCSLKSLESRAKIMMEIYSQRTKKLALLAKDSECKPLYAEAEARISSILGKSIITNPEAFTSFANDWKNKNSDLEVLSCPSLY